MTYSTEIAKRPNDSESKVFRGLVSEVISIQNQMDKTYNHKKNLLDLLLTAMDIP